VFAGGVARQLLAAEGIQVLAHVLAIGNVKDSPLDPLDPNLPALRAGLSREIPTLDPSAGEALRAAILAAKEGGDSLGGGVECVAVGVPAGLGAPFFDGVEAVAGAHFFSIPAVKGVEFGAGFGAAALRGSQYNDPYALKDGRVVTASNHAGGLLGGITTGMPIVARVAFRPTASISLEQKTVSLSHKSEEALTVGGRHDPCVVIRAVPVVESALALALCEVWLQRRGDTPLSGGAE
jgi:chorismate synthase